MNKFLCVLLLLSVSLRFGLPGHVISLLNLLKNGQVFFSKQVLALIYSLTVNVNENCNPLILANPEVIACLLIFTALWLMTLRNFPQVIDHLQIFLGEMCIHIYPLLIN